LLSSFRGNQEQELVIIPQRTSGSGTVIIAQRKSVSVTCYFLSEEIRIKNLSSFLRANKDQELVIISQKKSGSGTCYHLSEEIRIRNLSSFLRRIQDQERVIIP